MVELNKNLGKALKLSKKVLDYSGKAEEFFDAREKDKDSDDDDDAELT